MVDDLQDMIDSADYASAFELANYIFKLIGNVDIDDSNGGVGALADMIYRIWSDILDCVDMDEKWKMFSWFTTHLDGFVVDYLEDYIENIIMNGFDEKEFEQPKLQFIESMIYKSDSEKSEWSRSYAKGKWIIRYLSIMEKQKKSKEQIKGFCKKFWDNSDVRRYYIDLCMKNKEYDNALAALDDSISMDKDYRGLVSEYSKKKREIYLLQGNKTAYVEQLWKLVLKDDAGDMDIYRELKKQYIAEEWTDKREEIFEKLPKNICRDYLYKEEKLYDRLLDLVMQSAGLYLLTMYDNDLKTEYSKQILQKYKDEVNRMASHTGNRKTYQEIVGILRRMLKIKGGSKVVEYLVADWKSRYKNRPAMLDELGKL